jgi:anion-transporting  ArsA/GET3 family ATPase
MSHHAWPPLVVVVGSGGVGKTTLAAALGLLSAERGDDTLVMTFDPSLRLKDALGVGEKAKDGEVEVAADTAGELWASLLDARQTFDRLVARYAPDAEARDRILGNRYYRHLAGSLAGILEYMAVERLFEVAESGRYARVILDTPPTRQALDFLEAPSRIIGFLDSGALRLALRSWFGDDGQLKPTARLGWLGRRFESYLDEVVGLDLLREMVEFFQAFAPLYDGFRRRATQVEELLRSRRTLFVLVAGAGEEKIPDALFFARRLRDTGYRLGPMVVNRIHPTAAAAGAGQSSSRGGEGRRLLEWLGERDAEGFERLGLLVGPEQPLIGLPLLPHEPSDLPSLQRLGKEYRARLEHWADLAAAEAPKA